MKQGRRRRRRRGKAFMLDPSPPSERGKGLSSTPQWRSCWAKTRERELWATRESFCVRPYYCSTYVIRMSPASLVSARAAAEAAASQRRPVAPAAALSSLSFSDEEGGRIFFGVARLRHYRSYLRRRRTCVSCPTLSEDSDSLCLYTKKWEIGASAHHPPTQGINQVSSYFANQGT